MAVNQKIFQKNQLMYFIYFTDFLTTRKMKLCPIIALFLIPAKITHVYSQAELHWGARGSGHPPKISQLIDKSDSSKLVKKSPYLVSIIDQSPAEIPRSKPTISRMSDNSKGSSKFGMSIQLIILMHSQI